MATERIPAARSSSSPPTAAARISAMPADAAFATLSGARAAAGGRMRLKPGLPGLRLAAVRTPDRGRDERVEHESARAAIERAVL